METKCVKTKTTGSYEACYVHLNVYKAPRLQKLSSSQQLASKLKSLPAGTAHRCTKSVQQFPFRWHRPSDSVQRYTESTTAVAGLRGQHERNATDSNSG
jgi:hypothetical protein